ncbi:hypothetical protein SUGI_0192690 [Cryptomeria japonica]|nr:hypothetical protein SUGI_0192690 [Cryptomeria japonica]
MPFGIGASWTTVTDTDHMLRAAAIADKSAVTTAPHPNSGCVIARGPKIISEAFLRARGEKSAEIQAVEKARGLARGATAYLNLEPFADDAMRALLEAGLSRIVIGLENPVENLKGKALESFKSAGLNVQVLGTGSGADNRYIKEAVEACRNVNAPLLHTVAHGIPLSVLLTAEGGHMGAERLAELRCRCNGVVLWGNGALRVAYDLMVGQMRIGHLPVRIVVLKELDFVEDDSWLWDVSVCRTIVATCRGSRAEFRKRLGSRGVEVVELEELTPRALMEYCYRQLGFMSVLWECGGEFAASAILGGVIHEVLTLGGERKLISTFREAGDDVLLNARDHS